MRHPLYVGWLFAFWATPMMTLTHFVFALATTGVHPRSRSSSRSTISSQSLGDAYREYRKEVPALVPFTRKRAARTERRNVGES